MDTLHEDNPNDPHAYQRAGHLAAALGVTERTLRKMRARGEVESVTSSGRVYFRQVRAADRPDSGDRKTGTEGRADDHREVAALRTALIDARLELHETMTALHERLGAERERAARAEGATREATLLADVATRDAERAATETEKVRARAEALAAVLATERQRRRTAERYASVPWWRFSERRRLRFELELCDEPARLLLTEA